MRHAEFSNRTYFFLSNTSPSAADGLGPGVWGRSPGTNLKAQRYCPVKFSYKQEKICNNFDRYTELQKCLDFGLPFSHFHHSVDAQREVKGYYKEA
eukprot:scaffold43077_cov43-Prasinocladus_malaysianus.AAC.1